MTTVTAKPATLIVSGEGKSTRLAMTPTGVIVGRNAGCDVVLESGKVSRKHARIFQDPFERWIVEDLSSRNHVYVNDEQIENIRAVRPGERILIGPYMLVVEQEISGQIEADPTSHTTTSLVVNGIPGELVASPERGELVIPQPYITMFNEITDRIGELNQPSQLYPEVCRLLTRTGEAAAIVLRLPPAAQELSLTPQILSCRFGAAPAENAANLHLSRRVLEAVRSTGSAVMGSNISTGEAQLSLTLVDAARPRSVFCAPLTEVTGTVEVLYLDVACDQSPEGMLDFIRAISRQISVARKNLLLAEARAERSVLDRELERAKDIQTRLTPDGLTGVPGVDVAVRYQPAMWVGGDYCDVWQLEDGRLALAVADVCGKGLGAALLMSNLQAMLRATMSFCHEPAEIMAHVNRLLGKNLPDSMFVTFFLALFDPSSGMLRYVNAGHLPPVMLAGGGQVSPLDPGNQPVGVMQGTFREDSASIPHGSAMVVVTDGITESTSPGGKQLGLSGLESILGRSQFLSADQLAQHVVQGAAQFRQTSPQHDDETVLALMRHDVDKEATFV